jgi:hypothetical protein
MTEQSRILYCQCAHANVVPKETKEAVLQALIDADVPFDAVPDLCELAARKDSALGALGASGTLKIAACYPRAVRWLFQGAGFPLNMATTTICNMRDQDADTVVGQLLNTSGGDTG